MPDAVEQLLSLDAYTAVRKTKSGEALCDIRPFIHTLELKGGALYFTAYNLQSGSLKPSVVMEAPVFDLSESKPVLQYGDQGSHFGEDDKDDRLIPLEVISLE